MNYGYIRVSTDTQDVRNQEYEIRKFAGNKRILVDEWVEETVSGTRKVKDRKLGELVERMDKDDVLIVAEFSRLGRSLMEVMSVLNELMEKGSKVFITKEGHELGQQYQLQSSGVRLWFVSGDRAQHDLGADQAGSGQEKKRRETPRPSQR